MHDLSVIIVTYNSEKFIKKCIQSVFEHLPKELTTTVFVFDNASTDSTIDIVKANFPKVFLIESSENLGFGVGNNLAIEKQISKYYYLHNADAYLQGDSLQHAIELLDTNRDIAVAGLPLVFPDQSPQTGAYSFTSPTKWLLQGLNVHRMLKSLLSSKYFCWLKVPLSRIPMAKTYIHTHSNDQKSLKKVMDVDWVCGASMILRNDALKDLNSGFDPDIFLYGEDEDLCIRAHEKGWRVCQLPVQPVIHEFGWGTTGKSSPFVSKLKADSLRVFIDKHFKRYSLRWFAMRIMLWIQKKSWGI